MRLALVLITIGQIDGPGPVTYPEFVSATMRAHASIESVSFVFEGELLPLSDKERGQFKSLY